MEPPALADFLQLGDPGAGIDALLKLVIDLGSWAWVILPLLTALVSWLWMLLRIEVPSAVGVVPQAVARAEMVCPLRRVHHRVCGVILRALASGLRIMKPPIAPLLRPILEPRLP